MNPSRNTLCLDAADVVRLVRRLGLSACIADVAKRISHEFQRWPEFEKSARLAAHSADGVIELMPITDGTHYAFKYVNGHPQNPQFGLPTVMAFGVLADVKTGVPLLLSELTLATAIRTAATSAVAAHVLARPGSRSMALIGNGAQSEFQALAFRELLGVRELRLYDPDPRGSARLLANLAGEGFELRLCASTTEAVQGADIVTTITADKHRRAILTPSMIEPGMHLNAVGGDCPGKTELHPEVLERGQVFVEFEPQTRLEGEIQQMPPGFGVTELWQVLAGQAAGRHGAEQVTIFDSVGFALEDYAALCFLRDAAMELGIGSALALAPQTNDPKNLYGVLLQQAAGLANPVAAGGEARI